MFPGRGYNELKVGDKFESSMTMTETHIVLGAGLFGDFNPLHVNETWSKQGKFGGRIGHGYLTSNVMAAQMGMILHGTAIAYVEHNIRFTAPVKAGDTLTTTWTVTHREDKPKHNGGMVSFAGTCANQDGSKVADADCKLLVKNNG
ncbi:MAG: MaoC family dehydratase N-terminal domain-containing protein [Rhodocyclaceae bacterium]|nr:MaoC family dehydratase N-terminal domain-containing protein [Rhodocyclaceae bacterium]MBK7813737.1 MaoC family dehydratase N-terminal domain-containing protein [Rhodocyclaceae bacterium]